MRIQSNNGAGTTTVIQVPVYWLSDSHIAKRYCVSRQTVWRWAATDVTFPKPIKLSPGCTRWKLSDIEAWECRKTAANQSAEV